MSFSFDATAGTSQSTVKPQLAGNKIYTVKFGGCEKVDIKGRKDESAVYKVLKLKFENEDGVFEHTIFEPRESDFVRKENEYTDKDGKVNKIPQPSNVEAMMLLLKHIIDSVNPKVAKAIDSNQKSLGAKDWEGMRDLVIKILDPEKGKEEFKIKLVKNKNGDAQFPFFAGLNREGKTYVRNNFVGDKIAFSAYELQRIQNEATATPTNMSTTDSFSVEEQTISSSDESLDLGFDVDDL